MKQEKAQVDLAAMKFTAVPVTLVQEAPGLAILLQIIENKTLKSVVLAMMARVYDVN